MRFGLVVSLATAALGIMLGATSGYLGGWAGRLIMYVTDAFLAFPVIAAVWLFQRLVFGRIHASFVEPVDLQWWETALLKLEIDPIMLALILFGVGWNLLGDGLNAVLNPRTSKL